jgi:hypothetical protein
MHLPNSRLWRWVWRSMRGFLLVIASIGVGIPLNAEPAQPRGRLEVEPLQWIVRDGLNEAPLEVTFFSLLGAPEKFDDKVVAVAGVLDTTSDEGVYLFFSIEAFEHGRYDQAIRLDLDTEEKIEATHRFDRRWVRVEGVFDKPGPHALGTALGAASMREIRKIMDSNWGARQREPSQSKTDHR